MITMYIIIGIVILILVFVLITYNSLVSLKKRVEEAFSTMDVYLKKRWDLIPSIVETVKGYSKHEEQTFIKVTEMRNKKTDYDTMSYAQKIDINSGLSSEIPKIVALAESYPNLKANTNYLELMDTLKSVENDIANSRKYYNALVRDYSIAIQTFPNNIVAKLFKFKAINMFEAKNTERNNVCVEV